ncbi:uncharacterized protein LOC126814330 [Patella vulgata]|uniref:uncharacterized protein LOC126814330 n=1 Tax=Patella vulgata TaxID=6465 RepID=UPI00217F9DE4|nr:uncharacterized protein LOC126814330 [Patella vulgata]
MMAYNSLLPPELQAVYQQQYGGGGADGFLSQQSDAQAASQMTYYHEGQLPGASYAPMQQTYASPPIYGGPELYQQPATVTEVQQTPVQEPYQTPLPNAQNFSSQPVMGHYNPQPFAPHVGQSMTGAIPPPFKPMPVLPPIQSGGFPPHPVPFSSPAVLQHPARSFGQYTLDGTLEYGKLADAGDFAGSFDQIPGDLKRELEETYGVYPRTDVKIAIENGRYHLYATPTGQNPRGRALPPIMRPRFEHTPMELQPMRRSVGYPRQVFPRPVTGYSEDMESVNLSRASNYHHPFRSSSRRLVPGREPMIFDHNPYYEYDVESAIMEDIGYPSPPQRVYADYLRSSKLPDSSRQRYRSPTRYTARSKQRRSYSDGRRSYSGRI